MSDEMMKIDHLILLSQMTASYKYLTLLCKLVRELDRYRLEIVGLYAQPGLQNLQGAGLSSTGQVSAYS